MPEAGGALTKWIMGALLSALLILASGTTATAIALLSTPSSEEFEIVKERQQIVLQRLAVQETQMAELFRRIEDLREELRSHDEDELPRR